MRIVSLVLNNFKNDNRVYRIARSLQDLGHDVVVVGLLKGDVLPREVFKRVPVHRIKLTSMILPERNKFFGAIKYLEYFIKVIWFYRKWDTWHCNDFEAFLLGCVAKCTRPSLKLVYDCHEYERERYGLTGLFKSFVGFMEGKLIGLAEVVIVVGPSILNEYKRLYNHKNLFLVRNTPHKRNLQHSNRLREEFGISEEKKIFLYQGMISGGRGIELLLEAFRVRSDERAVLVIMGHGALEGVVKAASNAQTNVFFKESVPYESIYEYTGSADVGLNTPQNHCLSYYYCLPNKLFEYIQSGIPILTNDLPDCRSLVLEYGIGDVIMRFDSTGINEAIDRMLATSFDIYKVNLERARELFHWDEEVKNLIDAYKIVEE